MVRAILIVDDESPSRELIKMNLDWKTLGYGPLLEARNGREALAMYKMHKPYLVITDIQMPIMDGLELIRAIRQTDMEARIAILSCHESFSYAREALKMGVIDYLIKDQVTEEALINLLSTAEGWRYQPPTPLDTQIALHEALGDTGPSPEALEALKTSLGSQMCYFICAVRMEGPLSPEKHGDIYRRLAVFPGIQIGVLSEGLYILCQIERSVSVTRQIRERAETTCAVREALAFLPGPLTMGISRVKRKPQELSEAVEEARHAMNSFVFLGKGRNLYYEDACRQADAKQLQVLDQSINAIRQALGRRDGLLLSGLIAKLYKTELCGMLQYNYLKHINAVLLGILTQTCDENDVAYSRVFASDIISLETLEAMDSIEEICSWYQTRFSCICEALQVDYGPRLTGILHYIDENYCENISLGMLAHAFGINKAYLAKIFKAKTGISVNEHIRRLRMERAKALLNQPDARVGEVGDALGFHNPQTFYNLFKRYTGKSPSEYKEICDMKRAHKTLEEREEER